MRLPTLGEGLALATDFDIPNVDPAQNERFWTDSYWVEDGEVNAWVVDQDGVDPDVSKTIIAGGRRVVCVSVPTN